ncbi:hypothetical protein SAMN04487974_1239 [Pelagibacterium luteolum]|uniref:Uncharacterized protein n=1 Tax=Pelagibacterium luteolum TaxID=440168 RepID=A0A1G7ZV08_9HYPH|nr:hypothetical protein SAMN04487974_1239 [Pelagibacterium luteolum]
MAAIRRTSPCPEVTVLDVLTLAITLGDDFLLHAFLDGLV